MLAKTSSMFNFIVTFLTLFVIISYNLKSKVDRPVIPKVVWKHISSSKGELPVPNAGNQQTATLVCDINLDGVNDFMIAERTQGPSIVLYMRIADGWKRYIVEEAPLRIEAGSAFTDIDGDGDQDVVFGGDSGSNEVWWWENPYPEFHTEMPWKRRYIKRSGARKHHDQLFSDVTGDGHQELIFWNQGARKLCLAQIPDDPRNANEWIMHTIYTYESVDIYQKGLYPSWKGPNEHEGLAVIDMDGDGINDIIGGGRWFRHLGNYKFEEFAIDPEYTFSRSVAAQFIEGGRPEIILVAGDGTAPLVFYNWENEEWTQKVIIEFVCDGHSINVVDFNEDGHLDVFLAEMQLGNNTDQPAARVLLGDGEGNFEIVELLKGFGWHESLMIDLDGDGDLDILGKPYTWQCPRLDVWINEN